MVNWLVNLKNLVTAYSCLFLLAGRFLLTPTDTVYGTRWKNLYLMYLQAALWRKKTLKLPHMLETYTYIWTRVHVCTTCEYDFSNAYSQTFNECECTAFLSCLFLRSSYWTALSSSSFHLAALTSFLCTPKASATYWHCRAL